MKNKYVKKLIDLEEPVNSKNKTLKKILDTLNNVKGFEGYRWTGEGGENFCIVRSSFDRKFLPSDVKKNLPLWLRGTNIVDGIYVTSHMWRDWYGDYGYNKAYIMLQTREDYIDDLKRNERLAIRKKLYSTLFGMLDPDNLDMFYHFPFFKYNKGNYKQIWFDLINTMHSYIKEEEYQIYSSGAVVTQQWADYLKKFHKKMFDNMEKRHDEIDDFFKKFFRRPYPKAWKNYTLYSLKNSH